MFSIRTAGLEDRFLIHNLASQVWENTYGHILTKEQLAYMFEMMYAPESLARQMTELGHHYFIISHNDVPSGYLSIEKQDDHSFIFQKIYALPQTQGTGMGRYMIEQGVDYLKSIHPLPFSIILYVNRANRALGFYQHMGFQIIDTRDYAIGNDFYMNDYIMELKVES